MYNLHEIFKVTVFNKAIEGLSQIENVKNCKIYLVGGAVRDLLLNYNIGDINDLDFVVFNTNYQDIAYELAKKLRVKAIPFKDNMRLPIGKKYIDISAPRGKDIYQDTALRDFTVNNIAIDFNRNIIGCTDDLTKKVIRPVSDKSLKDDPIRILRGFRLALNLKFELSPAFLADTEEIIFQLKQMPKERINDELIKILTAPNNFDMIRQMNDYKVFETVLGCKVNLDYISKINEFRIQNNNKKYALMLISLILDQDVNTLNHLKLSNEVIKNIREIHGAINFLRKLSDSDAETLKKFIFDYWNNIDTIIMFVEKYHLINKKVNNLLIDLLDKIDLSKVELITGDDILNIIDNKPAGKWVGDLLYEIKLKLAFNEISGKTEVIEYIKKWNKV